MSGRFGTSRMPRGPKDIYRWQVLRAFLLKWEDYYIVDTGVVTNHDHRFFIQSDVPGHPRYSVAGQAIQRLICFCPICGKPNRGGEWLVKRYRVLAPPHYEPRKTNRQAAAHI